jgi:integrase
MRAQAICLGKGGEERMGVFRKQGVWWIDYRIHGQRRREKIGPYKALAETVLGKRRLEIAEGKFLGFEPEKKYTFAEAADRYLQYSETNKKSYDRDRCMLRKHLLPLFGKRQLEDITSWDIERYKGRRKKQVAPATVNRELSNLKAIYNKAILWKMTKDNPVRGVKFFRENNRRLRFLMPDEIRILLDNCLPYLKPMVITALNTGMRRGEIFNLTWKDLDFNQNQITIGDSKNGEGRTIPMNDLLAETLRRQKEERRPKNPFVFTGPTGKPFSSIQGGFKSACKRAGISDFRFHDLRHTFASHLVMNGVDLATVKELLGHKTLIMTLRYSHLSQGHKKNAVETVGVLISGHQMDTKPDSAASSENLETTQVVDFNGAGSGCRTRTSTRLKGF